MPDDTDRFKPVPDKEGYVTIPADATHEELDGIVAHFKALDAKYKPIREAKRKEAEAARQAEEARQAAEQAASANAGSSGSAAGGQ